MQERVEGVWGLERQLIRLGDDSLTLVINSIRREGGGPGEQHHCSANREWWKQTAKIKRDGKRGGGWDGA